MTDLYGEFSVSAGSRRKLSFTMPARLDTRVGEAAREIAEAWTRDATPTRDARFSLVQMRACASALHNQHQRFNAPHDRMRRQRTGGHPSFSVRCAAILGAWTLPTASHAAVLGAAAVEGRVCRRMSSPRLVILAHAPSAEAHAAAIAAELGALGYDVGRDTPRRAGDARIRDAHHYVVLWSKDALRAPGLREAARRARKAGKLASVRLDSALPPASLRGAASMSLPRGRTQGHAWRRLLEFADMSPAAEAPLPTSRITGVIALLLMAAVAGTAGYFSNAAFAAQVDSAAAKAQAMVAGITG